jgi:hypothetical protein
MYTKRDAVMTRGMAILSMLILHLFCRKGADVYGTPLLWLNETTPLVYWFGFFAEICVPIYTICAGYARQIENNTDLLPVKTDLCRSAKRIWRLLLNYWIVLSVFCLLSLLPSTDETIPQSFGMLLKNIFLLERYNGAWWFLNTYLILTLIPAKVILYPVKKIKPLFGVILSYGALFTYTILTRFFIPKPLFVTSFTPLMYAQRELFLLLDVLAYYWIGAFLCKADAVTLVAQKYDEIVKKCPKLVLLGAFSVMFLCTVIIEKAILISLVALATFFMFNIWKKGKIATAVFTFLGQHSTNIWLVHMFFYAYVFKGLVQKARYPIPMLLFLLALCVLTSYGIMAIQKGLDCVVNAIRHRIQSAKAKAGSR